MGDGAQVNLPILMDTPKSLRVGWGTGWDTGDVRRKHTQEFKLEAVRLVTDKGVGLTQATDERR